MAQIEPRWLKIGNAAKYAGMNSKRLITLAKRGEVTGFQDPDTKRNDWVFDRLSIDEYRQGQAGTLELEHAALDAGKRARLC